MAHSHQLLATHELPSADPASPQRWSGWRLALARAVWLGFAASALLILFFSVAGEFDLYLQTCAACDGPQLTPAAMRELAPMGLSLRFYAAYNLALELLFTVTWSSVAAVIFWRKSAEPLAWFVSLMLLTFGLAFPGFADVVISAHPGGLWAIASMPVLFVAVCSIVIFFYIFPDGHFAPRWARWLCLGWVLWTVYWFGTAGLELPTIYINSYYLALALGVGVQIYRYRSVANHIQRQQTKWVVFGITIAIGVFVGIAAIAIAGVPTWAGSALMHFISQTTIYLSMSLIPLSIGMAILRARLWDIDALISRTLVFAALTTCVIGLYVFVVGYLGALFQTAGNLLISLAATGLVAVLFQPIRDRLQRTVNRLLYGDRDDPYAAVSRLSRRLEATLAPTAVLPTIVETVAQALKLPYVAIALDPSAASLPDDQEAIVAAYGRPTPDLIFLPLTYQGEMLGQIVLAPRTAGEPLSRADQRLLADLARQAGVAAHAVQLTTALQRSREHLVTAREEERRRLRRDLHDGLGPQLAGLTLKLDAARNVLARDPAAARALLDELKGQTQQAIGDIRRLVYALRPPALDDLGLEGALKQQAALYEASGLRVDVAIEPTPLPALPAAVEVAVYRIAQEGLTNVVKHAQAQTGWLRVSVAAAGGVAVEVRDDGRGLSADATAGVGWQSMRERAAELGGRCEIAHAPEGGLAVVAWVPL